MTEEEREDLLDRIADIAVEVAILTLFCVIVIFILKSAF